MRYAKYKVQLSFTKTRNWNISFGNILLKYDLRSVMHRNLRLTRGLMNVDCAQIRDLIVRKHH